LGNKKSEKEPSFMVKEMDVEVTALKRKEKP